MPEFTPNDPNTMSYSIDAERVNELRRLVGLDNGRYLIGRDTPLLEGMYGGSYGGETIVVDYKNDTEYYDAIVDEVKQRATVVGSEGSKVDKSLILDSVFEVTKEKLAYSLEGVDKIFKEEGKTDHRKISLARYVEAGVGVCRHQALLAGTILELLGNQGVINGRASVDRSVQWPEKGDPEGHAWVRYTNSKGEVFILDPAQNFIGILDEAMQRDHGWNYSRPVEDQHERKERAAEHAGGIIDEHIEKDKSPKGALAAYESLTSEASKAKFKELVENSPTFEDLDSAAKKLPRDDFLIARDLMRLAGFVHNRSTSWSKNGAMNYLNGDPEIQSFIEVIEKAAVTEEQPFVREGTFTFMTDFSKTPIVIHTLKSDSEKITPAEPINVPVTSIVSATNFVSWEEGRGSGERSEKRDGSGKHRSSSEIIQEFASRETDIPSLDEAQAIIRDDGSVIILSQDAHRVAAAKLRGQENIGIRKLIIRRAKASEQ